MNEHQEDDHFIFDLNKRYDEKEDNNDLIRIQLSNNLIQIYYFQFCKYSGLIQDRFTKKDAITGIPQYVRDIKEKYNIDENNIVTFFKMFQEEKIEIKNNQYCDLCKLSNLFQVQILQEILEQYAKKYSNKIEFMINLLIQHYGQQNDEVFLSDNFTNEMEECLTKNINQCLKNQDFKKLPVSVVHRMIEKSERNNFSNDLLYEFISESIETRFVLFSFIDLKNLSENNFDDLYQKFMEAKDSDSVIYYQFLSTDIMFIKELKVEKNQIKNDLEDKIKKMKEENLSLQIEVQKLENNNKLLQDQVGILNSDNNLLSNQINQIKEQNLSYKQQLEKIENENKLLQDQIMCLKSENNSFKNQIIGYNKENKSYKQQVETLTNDNQILIHENNLIKYKKKNDDEFNSIVIQKILNKLQFDDAKKKSEFIKSILERTEEMGTIEIVRNLKELLGIKSENDSIFF